MGTTVPEKEDKFDAGEAQRRFEAALRGARVVGHKSQSEMKIGKSRPKRNKKHALKKHR
jgi:hypothetical protein